MKNIFKNITKLFKATKVQGYEPKVTTLKVDPYKDSKPMVIKSKKVKVRKITNLKKKSVARKRRDKIRMQKHSRRQNRAA